MAKPRYICDHCRGNIVEYYDEGYSGTRGKCPRCGIDFPLE